LSEAIEALEHAEHASHAAGHGHDSSNKAPARLIGLTMALMGVLIAFCAALVGGQRNELTRTMIEQTQAHSDAGYSTIRYRLVMLDLEKQRAQLQGSGHAAAENPAVRTFLGLYADYDKERKVSKDWADSYDPLVKAHFEGAENYEHAQLIAEIGIVLASLGVLLSSRPPWYLSMVLGVLCIAQIGRTYVHTRHEVNESMEHEKHSEEAYLELRKARADSTADQETVEALDPGGVLRAENAAAKSNEHHHAAEPEKH
jgi:hypothetical protein